MDTVNPMQKNIETNLTDLKAAHSEVTNIMITQNESGLEYAGPNIPFNMVYIDDDTLVVGLDPLLAHPDYAISPEIIQEVLGIDLPVEVKYASFEDESLDPRRKAGLISQYERDCMPVLDHRANTCKRIVDILTDNNVPIPGGKQTQKTDPVPVIAGFAVKLVGDKALISWDADNASGVKYYRLYVSENYDSYKYKDQISKYSESYTLSSLDDGKRYQFKLYTYYIDDGRTKVKIAYSNHIMTPKVVPPVVLDINNVNARQYGDDVRLAWDRPSVHVLYYKIYVSEGGSYYKNKGTFDKNTRYYTLSDVDDGKTYKFKLKAYYANESNRQTIKYFYSKIVDVPKKTLVDRTPPVITAPNNMVRLSNGPSPITYDVTVIDDVGGVVPINCIPPSGSIFPIGRTVVTCTATDATGNVATKSFTIGLGLLNQCVIGGTTYQGYTCERFDQLDQDVREYLRYLDLFTSNSLIGGSPIIVHNGSSFGSEAAHGTIGLVLDGTDGKPKILTASHVANQFGNNGIAKIYNVINPLGIGVGSNILDIHLKETGVYQIADASLITVSNSKIDVESNRILYNNSILPVTSFGGVQDKRIGTPIHIAGIHNNSVGGLQYHNVTIGLDIDGTNVVMVKQEVANYSGEKGDSGAPVFIKSGNTANLVGIHIASGCMMTLDTGSILNARYGNDGTLACHSTDNALFKIFTPWENIVEKLSIYEHIVKGKQ